MLCDVTQREAYILDSLSIQLAHHLLWKSLGDWCCAIDRVAFDLVKVAIWRKFLRIDEKVYMERARVLERIKDFSPLQVLIDQNVIH